MKTYTKSDYQKAFFAVTKYSFIIVVVLMSIVYLGMTWMDPRGGSSWVGDPILSSTERITRSILPIITLLMVAAYLISRVNNYLFKTIKEEKITRKRS